ncbi:hypothetical protein [Sphingomonas sp.]|uniref:hypothetical protein n=1 Tax=Sphingomonas sp. TaxID=28214 RepID=UPI00286E6100|nr:hypothetical protein [Sphingomonas sp.]
MNMNFKMNPGHDARHSYVTARAIGAAKPRTLRTTARPPRNALAYAAALDILG